MGTLDLSPNVEVAPHLQWQHSQAQRDNINKQLRAVKSDSLRPIT